MKKLHFGKPHTIMLHIIFYFSQKAKKKKRKKLTRIVTTRVQAMCQKYLK